MNPKTNLSWVNNLRLISMFAVVVLHTASALIFNTKAPAQDWLVGDFYNALVRFAVPVFVMITGALLLHRDYELGDFLKKRIGRLIAPFFFWSLVYISFRLWNEEFEFGPDAWTNIKFVLHQLKTGSYYHLWYVYLLFGMYLFIPILGKFVKHATKRELLYFWVVWFITMLVSKPYLNRFETAVDLHNFSGYIGYLVLGHYLAYKQFNDKGILPIAWIMFLACVALITAGTWYILNTRHELSTFFYEPIGPFVMVMASSALLIAKHTVVNLPPMLKRMFHNAGSYTLGIYLSHALLLSLFDLAGINYAIFTPVLSIPAIALACFLLSWLLIYLLGKVPVVKNVIG
jgi:surface polysaccharide O-acyltransferase-like enzyme